MRVVTAVPADIPAWLLLGGVVESLYGLEEEIAAFRRALEHNIARQTAFCVRENNGPPGVPLLGGVLLSQGPTQWEISWIGVAHHRQRQGVGSALLKHALAQVNRPGKVVLLTFGPGLPQGRAARRFFVKHGFRPAGYGPQNDTGIPTQVFRCDLPKYPDSVRGVVECSWRFLVVQHNHLRPQNAGKWSIPGGAIAPEDINHRATLQRELHEELQLDVTFVRFLATYPYRGRDHHIYHVRTMYTDVVLNPDEILDFAWLTIEEVTVWHEAGRFLQGFELDVIRAASRDS